MDYFDVLYEDEFEDEYDYYDYDRDDAWTCLFPSECLVYGPHMSDECYTATTIAEQNKYYEHEYWRSEYPRLAKLEDFWRSVQKLFNFPKLWVSKLIYQMESRQDDIPF